MKHRRNSSALLLILTAPMLLGQPLPDLLQVSGFQLPSIRSGRLELSLSTQYRYGPFSDSAWSTMMGARPVELNLSSSQKRLQFQTSFLYGIDDRTTASLSLSFLPRQSTGDESYTTESVGWPALNSRGLTRSSQFDESSVSVGFVVTHRPRHNLEWNLGGYFRASNQPSIKTEGQKVIRPFPYLTFYDFFPSPFDPCIDPIEYPSFPDINGSDFKESSSSRQRRFGLKAGIAMISDETVTTDYVKPFGYSLPPLRQGKVVASLNFFYERQPVDFLRNDQRINQYLSSSLQLNGYDISDATHSFYGGDGHLIYGVSDRSTAEVRINLAPDQSSTDETITGRYYNITPSIVHNRDQSINEHVMQIHLNGEFVNRPSAGLELSLGMKYDVNRLRQESAAVLAFNDYGPSDRITYEERPTTRQTDFGVHLGVAVLSDGSHLESYLPLSRYLLPILAHGQFGVYGEAAYLVEWRTEVTEVEVLGYHSAETASSWRIPRLRFTSSFLYGLFDDATALLTLEYVPTVTQGSLGLTNINLSKIVMDQFIGVFRQEDLLVKLIFAYRPTAAVELSFRFKYSDDRRPSGGTHSALLLFNETSTIRIRDLTAQVGIALQF